MWSQWPWVSSTRRTPSAWHSSSSRSCSLAASMRTASPVRRQRMTNTLLSYGPTTTLWTSTSALTQCSVVVLIDPVCHRAVLAEISTSSPSPVASGRAQSSHAPHPPVRRRARRRRWGRRRRLPGPDRRPAVASGLATHGPRRRQGPERCRRWCRRSVGADRALVVRRDPRVRARAARPQRSQRRAGDGPTPRPAGHGSRPGRRRTDRRHGRRRPPDGADRPVPRGRRGVPARQPGRALGRAAERPRHRRDR